MKQKDGKCISFFAFTSNGKITPVSCGKWSCPHCSKENARLWAWRARLQLDCSPETYYVWTFTLGSRYKLPSKGYSILPKLWDNLRKVVVRWYSRQLKEKNFKWVYMAFVEAQPKKRKMPHFHIITNVPAPYRIKDFAVHNGFGHQAKQDEITSKKAAYYVSKYVSKGDPNMPKKFRRVRTSQSWAKLPPYVGNKLYVKSKKESITAFLLRVADETGRDLDDLWDDWKWAHEID
jgi:hypothetical protein